MKIFGLLLAVALPLSASIAQASTLYVCGAADYLATYGVSDGSRAKALAGAIALCRAKSRTPKACTSVVRCAAFANRKIVHVAKVVPFDHPLRVPSPSSGNDSYSWGSTFSGSADSTPAAPPEAVPHRFGEQGGYRDGGGTTHYENGSSSYRDGGGTTHYSDGSSAYTDGGGTTHFSDGSSSYTDGGGTTHNSDGTSSYTDGGGTTHYSDGRSCYTDGGGTRHCM